MAKEYVANVEGAYRVAGTHVSLDSLVLRGLRRVAPEIDMRTAAAAGLTGLADSEVLRIAAADGRILVSQDRTTMPGHFRCFVTGFRKTCVILVRRGIPIGVVI